MRLFILIFFCLQGIVVSSREPCVYQVKTRIVQSGGSVIIPCSYTDPKIEEEPITVRWLESRGNTCQDKGKVISEKTKEKYGGRLFTWKDPYRNRTHNLEITGLKPTDGPIVCCQIVLNKNPEKVWKSQHGTLLQFSDEKFASQLDELITVTGEDIIIPCRYPKIMTAVHQVTWYYVQKDFQLCGTAGTKMYTWNNRHQHGRYSLVNFPQIVSLHIRNIRKEDQGGYCCAVTPKSEIFSKQVTMLLVADQQSFYAKNSSEIVQKGGSVNLNCSYTVPELNRERDVVRVNVYWRVGNVTGPYAYHPYQEMVHSSYVNRTNITGIANLHLKNVWTEDNTTFHCFVVLKMCKDENQYEDKVMYGGEIRLNVEENPHQEEPWVTTERTHSTERGPPTHGIPPTDGSAAQKGLPNYVIIIITSVIILIILILILIILKAKGVLCMRKRNISAQQINPILAPGDGSGNEMLYCEISSKKPDETLMMAGTDDSRRKEMENGEDDTLLYARLDQTNLNDNFKRQAQHRKHSEEVVYADVVNTVSK